MKSFICKKPKAVEKNEGSVQALKIAYSITYWGGKKKKAYGKPSDSTDPGQTSPRLGISELLPEGRSLRSSVHLVNSPDRVPRSELRNPTRQVIISGLPSQTLCVRGFWK